MKRILSLLLLPGLLLPGLLTGCGEKEPDLYPLVGQTVEEALAELKIDSADLAEQSTSYMSILPGSYNWLGREWTVMLGHNSETMVIDHVIYHWPEVGPDDLEEIRTIHDQLVETYEVSEISSNNLTRFLEGDDTLDSLGNTGLNTIFVRDGEQVSMGLMWEKEAGQGYLQLSLSSALTDEELLSSAK